MAITEQRTTFLALKIETPQKWLQFTKTLILSTSKSLDNTQQFITCYFLLFFAEINICSFGLILKQKLYNENILQEGYFSGTSQNSPSQNLNHSKQSQS